MVDHVATTPGSPASRRAARTVRRLRSIRFEEIAGEVLRSAQTI
jgi:hypothetical protein